MARRAADQAGRDTAAATAAAPAACCHGYGYGYGFGATLTHAGAALWLPELATEID